MEAQFDEFETKLTALMMVDVPWREATKNGLKFGVYDKDGSTLIFGESQFLLWQVKGSVLSHAAILMKHRLVTERDT